MFTSQQLIGDIEASTGGVLWNNILKAFAKLTGKHLSLFVFCKNGRPEASCYFLVTLSYERSLWLLFLIFGWIISMHLSVFSEFFLSTYAYEIHLYWLPYYSRHLFILQILICVVLIEIPAFSWILKMLQEFFKSLTNS